MQRVQMTNSVLDGADFTDADLRRASFANSTGEFPTMTRANLSGANLSKVYFLSPDLEGAKFVKAILSGAELPEAQLMGANLTGANLTNADLRYADLTGAKLTGAILTGAKLGNARINGRTCAAESIGTCR